MVMELLICGEFLSYPSLIGQLKKDILLNILLDIPRDVSFLRFYTDQKNAFRTTTEVLERRHLLECRAVFCRKAHLYHVCVDMPLFLLVYLMSGRSKTYFLANTILRFLRFEDLAGTNI